MKRMFHWLKNSLTQDDLYLRVLFFVFGTVMTGGGAFWLFWLATQGSSDPVWQGLGCAFATLLTAWGTLVLSRTIAPLNSKLARWAEKAVPDASDEGALVLLFVFCLPAALLTLVLRALGVQGQTNAPSSQGGG